MFSHDVTAAILVSQNNETVAVLVSQTSPLGVELVCYANTFFCSNTYAQMLATWVKTLYILYSFWNKWRLALFSPVSLTCVASAKTGGEGGRRTLTLSRKFQKLLSFYAYKTWHGRSLSLGPTPDFRVHAHIYLARQIKFCSSCFYFLASVGGVKRGRGGGGRERLRKAWKGKGPLPSVPKPPPFFPFFPVPYPFVPLLLLGIDIIQLEIN